MTLMIAGTNKTGVALTTGDNPVFVGPTAYLSDADEGLYGLFAPAGTTWNITNQGLITGNFNTSIGVTLGGAGMVANKADGAIYGNSSGVQFSGLGTVSNAGVISGEVAGVRFLDGGSVDNQSSGTISGGPSGVYATSAPGTITNAGGITGSASSGIFLHAGGDVINQSGGTIAGALFGIYVTKDSGTVTNAGIVAGESAFADGISLRFGGNVTNEGLGSVQGVYYGVFLSSPGTLTNAGAISGTTESGLGFFAGGDVTNESTGTIIGAKSGVYMNNGPGTVTNAGGITGTTIGIFLHAGASGVSNQSTGTISGGTGIYGDLKAAASVTNAGLILGTSRYGVWLTGGGAVTNQSTGTISGSSQGIVMAGTVCNAGTIGGGGNAIGFYGGSANRLIVAPGAVFSGTVNGGNAIGGTSVSTIELAAGTTPGVFSGLGFQFVDFAQVTIDAGAFWTLTGANALAAGTTITNAGGLTILDGSLSDAGSVINDDGIQDDATAMTVGTLTGAGQVRIGEDSTLTVTGSVGSGQTIAFAGSGLLAVVPAKFAGQINGLGEGARIDLTGISDATSAEIINGNTLAIQRSAGPTLDLTLDPTQDYAEVVFPIATADGNQFVGASAQPGPTVIDQGETESVTGAAGSTLAAITGAVGGITVTGADSLLTTTTDPFMVGDAGLGVLAIEDSGSVTAGAGLVIANTPSASGSSVEVTGTGSDLAVTGSAVVGEGGYGSLSLSQGATVTATSLTVGGAATANGDVSLAGVGTTLDITGSLTLGGAAAGELSILGGAGMTIGGGVIGSSNSAPGNLDVEGANSLLTINGGTLTVGASGPAEFTLGIGATLSGEVANGPFGVVSEYGNVDPATDPNDGTQNVGFGNSLTYDYYVANSGTIKITSGTATFYSPLVTDETNAADSSTSGLWVIGAHETLVMNTTSVDATQSFDFTSASAATLVIGEVPQAGATQTDTFNGQTMPALTGSIAPGSLNVLPGWDAPIENYQSGDLIVLRGLTYGSATASGDVVTVWSQGGGQGSALGSLTFVTRSGAASQTEAAAAATQINSLACFAEGTRIGTADGWVKVEELRVGDLVATADGGSEPIVWVGSRAVDCARHPRPVTVWPVRVARGAFGENVPARDVYLSPDHAVFVGDVLIPVRLLVNGTSITRVKRQRVTYFHVELPEHSVILAEGLAVESYLHTGDRANFAGGATIQLFPDFAARLKPDAAGVWETRGAASLVQAGDALEAARRMVMDGTPRSNVRSAGSASQVA